jgi:hypothetical protein
VAATVIGGQPVRLLRTLLAAGYSPIENVKLWLGWRSSGTRRQRRGIEGGAGVPLPR